MAGRFGAASSARRATRALAKGVAVAASGHEGTLYNWWPRRESNATAPRDRETLQNRAADLASNDPHAAGLLMAMTVNIVGPGLRPQSRIPFASLGISEELANGIQDQAEESFGIWSLEADAGRRMSFGMIQNLAFTTSLGKGEFLNLCRMKDLAPVDGPARTFALALRSLNPQRLKTPSLMSDDPRFEDGIELGEDGESLAFHIAQPDPYSGRVDLMGAEYFERYPAYVGHRPQVLHGFFPAREEQARGISVLAPAVKMFRDLSDFLDYELIGQIISAAFPVVVKTDSQATLGNLVGGPVASPTAQARPDYKEIRSGQVMYLRQGEDAHALESNRPGNNFAPFVERILRAVGNAAGVPYEVVARDFSKTNYSSARAALLEAQRVFAVYQSWFEFSFCRPVWAMVFEEAFLRGLIKLPKSAPDFYAAMPLYCRSSWIPPKRGHVDPLKEMQANILGLAAKILTYADVIDGAEPDDKFRQAAREKRLLESYDLTADLSGSKSKAVSDASDQEPGDEPVGGSAQTREEAAA